MQCDLKHYQESDVAQKVQQLINTHIYEVKDDKLCTEPLVSVWLLTYNHKNFIDEAINSILVQQTNFSYEIVIGDDCSTDGTNEIIRNYQTQYPDKIRLLLAKRNLWQPLPGIQGVTSVALYQTCRGKYIALCEGDDYWTDPLKLQKQVDFLETNPDFAICFHNVAIINEDYPERNRLNNDDLTPEISTLDNLLEGNNYIATCSAVIKTNLIQNLPDWFTSLPFGDYGLYLIAARHGKIKYINEIMSVYRIHQGGIHGHLGNSDKGMSIAYQQHYDFWRVISESGIINQSNLNQVILREIHNVISSSTKSGELRIFIKYNYLLLRYSRGKRWRFVIGNLIIVCHNFINRKKEKIWSSLSNWVAKLL